MNTVTIAVIALCLLIIALQAYNVDRLKKFYENELAKTFADKAIIYHENDILKEEVKASQLAVDNLWDNHHRGNCSMDKVARNIKDIMEGKASSEQMADTRLFLSEWFDYFEEHMQHHDKVMASRKERDM